MFVFGGHNGEQAFDDLWHLNLSNFQWTLIEMCSLPQPTYFHGAAASPEGRLFIFGGIHVDGEDSRRGNSTYSTWLCIPKLSEMCWEAVLHYSPHISRCKSDELIDAGLPRHFVHRLGNED